MNTEERSTHKAEPTAPVSAATSRASARAGGFSFETVAELAHRRWAWLVLLLVFALCYYGSYVRHGISFRDEGGTVALLSKRLLEGQRPFLEVELGYNVLWFYPVVGLFKIFGVSFVLLRAYCFALSTITAVFGFFAIDRVTRRPWFAFLVGLLLVLIPGSTFKNYIPLMAVANICCLLQYVLAGWEMPAGPVEEMASPLESRVPWRWLFRGALVLGVTWLIRVEIGNFATVLWVGAIALRSLDFSVPPRTRFTRLMGGWLLLIVTVCAVHLPVVLNARHRGFAEPFLAQYVQWPKSIVIALTERFGRRQQRTEPPVPPPPSSAALDPAAKLAPLPEENEHSLNRQILARPTVKDLFESDNTDEKNRSRKQQLFLLLYAPLLSLLPLVAWALIDLRNGWALRDNAMHRRSLGALVALGGALIAFPQYFFFRPDAPHLSEFSPGFWVGSVASLLLLGARGGLWPRGQTWRRWPFRILAGVLLINLGLFLFRMFPDKSTGSIAARCNFFANMQRLWHHPKKAELFHGANGVNVYLTRSEFEDLTALVKVIREHAKAGDYLLVYPYHPSINLITDLPTYEIDLYVDNATHSRTWETGAITRMEKYRPAVIALSDWEINDTEASRFSVWAARTKAWIQAHYDFQGFYMGHQQIEVYTRRPEGTEPSPGP